MASLVPRILASSPFRLFAVYVALFCSVVAATFIYVYIQVQVLLVRDVDHIIQAELADLQDRFQRAGLPSLIKAVQDRASWNENSLYLITDANKLQKAGNLKLVSTDLWNTEGRVYFLYRKELEAGRTVTHTAYGAVMRFSDGTRLIVARDAQGQEDLKRLMRLGFLTGYTLIVLVGLIGGIVVSRRILARVDAASKTARAIMQGNLSERIPLTPHDDEFNRLNSNLNMMLDRIHDLMNGLKDVSDNIAHDLKTPLHRLRTRAERALQANASSPDKLAEALAAVIEDADTLIKTFDALLNIARLESGARALHFGELNICGLVRDVAELYEPAAEERGLRFQVSCLGDIMIGGEKHLIGQAVANLLDNAIKYACTEVKIHLDDKGDSVDIVVADRGEGIREEDRERVFQRFVRLQPSRSMPGSGLGLSLVAAVARLHGGTVSLEDNQPGLRVRLRLHKNLEESDPTLLAKSSVHHAV